MLYRKIHKTRWLRLSSQGYVIDESDGRNENFSRILGCDSASISLIKRTFLCVLYDTIRDNDPLHGKWTKDGKKSKKICDYKQFPIDFP